MLFFIEDEQQQRPLNSMLMCSALHWIRDFSCKNFHIVC